MNVTNKCEHKFIKIVSAHFVTNENCYVDYHWCKKCGTVEAVKTYDESFIENWVPDLAVHGDCADLLSKYLVASVLYFKDHPEELEEKQRVEKKCGCDDPYDYYDGPDLITKIKEEDGVVCGALSPVPCEDCKEKECYYYAGDLDKGGKR